MSRYMPHASAKHSFSYDGNKLTSSVNGSGSAAYSYYANGNLKSDSRRDLQFRYDLLNLPAVVTDTTGQVIKAKYSYLADGTKLSVRDAQNDGLNYRGSFIYTVDGSVGSTDVTEKLESISHDEGRFLALSASAGVTTTQFIDTWHIRDHLGSIRTVLDITRDTSEVSNPTLAILEQNDYLPFGTRIDIDSLAYDQSNRYRFNCKEEQVTGSLGLTDYGARFYDNTLPRWTTPDPLAEKYTNTLNVFAHTEFAAAVLLVVEIIFLDDLETALLKSTLSPVPVPPDYIRSLSCRGSVCFCAGPLSCFVYLFQGLPA